jgi:serine/threonine protein kinase/TPR repeat protein
MADTITFAHFEVLTREDGSLFELGRGAMGITYKAFDTNLRVFVALKVIAAQYLQHEVARQRFVREARAAAQLRHPNVASVFHLGTEADSYFYAMEFVDGETVEALIKRNGPMDPAAVLRIAIQAARALTAASKHHLVHRDIKPANLMLVREEEDVVVKVIDFGLAKSIKRGEGEDLATVSIGGFVGTAQFASPEQLMEKDLDVRSDIYSLGITLWYMLAGRPPFGGSLAQVMSQHLQKPPPMEHLAHLPAELQRVVAHMIDKDPTKRPQTAAALRLELEKCLANIGAVPPLPEQEFATVVDVDVPTPGSDAPITSNSRTAIIVGILGLLAALAIGVGGILLFRHQLTDRLFPAARPSASPTASAVALATPTSAAPIATVAATSPTAAPAVAATSATPAVERQAELKRLLDEAQAHESSENWSQALGGYLRIAKEFPESDVGRVRLELLLTKLQSEGGGISAENFLTMRDKVTEAAELDVVSAMEILGDNLRKREPQASFNWWCAAAAHGRARAMREVGLRYSNGTGAERDFTKAVQWLDMAMQAGDVSAKTFLAECYLGGKGVPKAPAKAIALLKEAVAANDPLAMDKLANCYHKGIGVRQDDTEAFRLYSDAAKLNYPDAQGNLGVLYLTSSQTDLGKDEAARRQKAVTLFRDGASRNNAFCMFLLAQCIEGGVGVDRNTAEAANWYRRAAEADSRQAQEWCRQHNVAFNSEEAR